MIRKWVLTFLLLLPFLAETKLPELTPEGVNVKISEILKEHASHKELNDVLIRRTLLNYIELLDPNKSYFIQSDIEQWLNPSDAFIEKVLAEFKQSNFATFEEINQAMAKAIYRRRELEKEIDVKNLPKKVNPEEFKDIKWTTSVEELKTRLMKIRALQIEAAAKLNEELKENSLQRIQKRQAKYEQEILNPDPIAHERLLLSDILKAMSAAMDAHTSYFTPDEATQFMINVQQRLFGIGAQLRDDLNGFTVVKIIEGGPAAQSKQLKVKDKIIAVDSEPVVGMDINDAVELIRGKENTPVKLTIIRSVKDGEESKDEKLDVSIPRGEVVLKETRYESNFVPYGDGAIAYLRLYSFYQDADSSSAEDLSKAIKQLKEKYNIKGLLLDLRFNSGGMLSQAVNVTGLFISKGIVVSIKDDTGHVQHLRHLDGKIVWDGPLIVLENRGSASASEIVAGTLKDYGRALIVGDDHTFGKGSFQTFTLNTSKGENVNPQGEYKVTRGRYYTVSGQTPQLTGVSADIVVPGILSESDVGEKFAKYPLENDSIKDSFDDDLSDIPFLQRGKIRLLYKFDLQPRLTTYQPYLERLKKNSEERIANNKSYQTFIKELQKKDHNDEEQPEEINQFDLQLNETYNIMRDLLYLMEFPEKKSGVKGDEVAPSKSLILDSKEQKALSK